MSEEALRQGIVDTAQALPRLGLSAGTTGNVSAFTSDGTMLITPTGVPYQALTPEKIVRVGMNGDWQADGLKPSSEWRMHMAIYIRHRQAEAIVHCHSDHATALACTGKGIPAFHYMVAAAGGKDIRCAPYALFGSTELADLAADALDGRKACLLANHGQIALGETLEQALSLAHDVEILARQYAAALAIGGVRELDDAQMDQVLKRFKTYGQQPTD